MESFTSNRKKSSKSFARIRGSTPSRIVPFVLIVRCWSGHQSLRTPSTDNEIVHHMNGSNIEEGDTPANRQLSSSSSSSAAPNVSHQSSSSSSGALSRLVLFVLLMPLLLLATDFFANTVRNTVLNFEAKRFKYQELSTPPSQKDIEKIPYNIRTSMLLRRLYSTRLTSVPPKYSWTSMLTTIVGVVFNRLSYAFHWNRAKSFLMSMDMTRLLDILIVWEIWCGVFIVLALQFRWRGYEAYLRI
ncbi:unnamed protein product [Sphagnum balticum]